MKKRYSKDPAIESSLSHSVKDGIAYSVMSGGGESYFSAFALFLKASSGQIALLASLPPLLGSLVQILSAWLGRLTGRRKAVVIAGALIQAFSWAPIMFLPFLFPSHAPELLILGVILYFCGANLATPQWSSMMGDIVPERKRGRYFGMRTRLASITSFIALVLSGLVLHYAADRTLLAAGFLFIFGVAALARFISVWYLYQMQDRPGHTAAMEFPAGRETLSEIRRSPFARFSLFFALMQLSVAVSSPFFTVFLLQDLRYSYLQFMTCTATIVMFQFLTLNTWGRIGDFLGNRIILILTGLLIPLLPLLWIPSQNFWYLMTIQALGGLLWAGYSLSSGNFLYELIPPERRATFLAAHNILASVGLFIGAMIGGKLATSEGAGYIAASWGMTEHPLYVVFAVSSMLRFLTALVFLPRLKEVRPVRPPSFSAVFRVVRFNPISGLIFDIVTSKRKENSEGNR